MVDFVKTYIEENLVLAERILPRDKTLMLYEQSYGALDCMTSYMSTRRTVPASEIEALYQAWENDYKPRFEALLEL